jgi:SAM-dependent methyltransferase
LLLAERDRGLLRETTRQGWRHAPPRRGRHYPRGLLNEFPRRDLQPFRVVEVRDNCLLADFNTPWHGIEAAVDGTPIGTADAIGATAAPDDLVASVASGGPGMQATLTSADTDFFAGAPFARADETDDSRFYDRERLVDHLDAPTRAEIAALYRRLLRPGMVVLDLMASWNSHLPDDLDIAVTGLGMNATELGHNPRLRERLVHDLNRSAPLPWPEPAFDAALCALSIEYLVHPLAVVRELARVLKPGAPFVVTFSDRWFPPKAIALWSELHPFERLALVVDYLRLSGGFDNIQTESLRGLPAPTGVWRPPGRRHADPLFAVWGYRVSRR